MKEPKFSKGDRVTVQIDGKEVPTSVIAAFPVKFGFDLRPIIKPVHQIEYSYMLECDKSKRFDEELISPIKPTKKSE